MKVLFISSYWYYANLTSSFVHAQAKAYARAGMEVKVIIPTPLFAKRVPYGAKKCSHLLYSLKTDNVEIYYLLSGSLSNFGNKIILNLSINNLLAIVSLAISFKKIFRDYNPDVIHVHSFVSGDVGRWLKKKLHKPLVVTTHGGDTNAFLDKGEINVVKHFCQDVDLVVTVSKMLEKRLRECDVESEIWTNYLGCEGDVPIEIQDTEELNIVSCANLIPLKRIDLIIEALSKIPFEIPINWYHLGDGPLREELEELAARKLGHSSHIKYKFLGFVSNEKVRNVYRDLSAQLFVSTSSTEGLPVSMMEAVSIGMPLIGTNVGGVAEILYDSQNGFLLETNPLTDDVAGVIEKFYYLDNLKKNRMSKTSIQVWNEKFNIDRNVSRIKEKYLGVY